MTIRVVLADDDPRVRATLRRWLDAQADMTVVGEAEDGEELVRKARETAADVFVVDVKMPKRNGLDAMREMRGLGIDTPAVIFTSDDKAAGMLEGLGDVRYLAKGGTGLRQVSDAIRSAAG